MSPLINPARTMLAILALGSLALPGSYAAVIRTMNGAGNNLAHPFWGAAETPFARLAPADYADGVSQPRLLNRPNPRSVAVALMRQTASRPNARQLSGYVYAFGNLISHDTQHTISSGTELIPFRIPPEDDIFFPGQQVNVTRSLFDSSTGSGVDNPRQQTNFATSFLDASVIYGSDDVSASILRGGPAHPGAKLRTSDDINGYGQNLLPRDAFGPRPTAPFVAGDERVNDNVVLTAMQTLFMREHNRLVDDFASQHPDWNEEELYQHARRTVGAQLQAITFNEFLPALLGPAAPSPTGNYDPTIDPSVFNEFPAVFLRIGHSMLTDTFKRVENDGSPASEGHLPLVDAFNNPAALSTSRHLDLFLKGLSVEVQEETDLRMVDGMRIALLDAIDIQRARDHGIADYNSLRAAYGLSPVTTFEQITGDPELQAALQAVYGTVDDIDPFVGALAEDLLPGASVGELVAAGYRVQFERLRDGDRFWYENDAAFSSDELASLRSLRLSDLVHRNSDVDGLQTNIFFAVPEPCSLGLLAIGIAGILLNQDVRRLTP